MIVRGMFWPIIMFAPDGAGGGGGDGGAAAAGDGGADGKAKGTGAAGDNPEGGNNVAPAKKPGKEPTNASVKPRARPDWVAEKFWDADAGNVKVRDLHKSYDEIGKKLSMRTEDLRAADRKDRESRLPKKPQDYKFRVDGKYVEAMKQGGLTVDPEKAVTGDDPMARMLAVMAHKFGLDQEQFEEMASIYHYTRGRMKPDFQAETLKLGENGRERIAHVKMNLEARIGAERTQELVKGAGGPSARFIESMEMLLRGSGMSMPAADGMVGFSGDHSLDKEKIKSLQASRAYRDKSHPDHAATVKKVTDGWAAIGGGRAYTGGLSFAGR